jgi:hypothetical protein
MVGPSVVGLVLSSDPAGVGVPGKMLPTSARLSLARLPLENGHSRKPVKGTAAIPTLSRIPVFVKTFLVYCQG